MDISSSVESTSTEKECPLCKGARFVHPLMANGKPDYSRIVPCRCAMEEAEVKRTERLQKYSNLGPLTRLTFTNLVPEGKSKEPASQEQFHCAYDQAREFAKKPEGWLVFTGPSGCGKTHLAVAIVNQCIENGIPAFYITASDLLDHLRASFNPASEIPYDEFFEQVRNTAVLVLDDFGIQSGTPWAKEKLDQLLSHRHNNRLPTVIISTLPIEELEERVRTRLVNTEFCHIFTLGSNLKGLSQYSWAPGLELQKKMTFETFNLKRVNLPLEQQQNLELAYETARNFAESPDGWLILAGVNGCGKTHLAAAIVNYRYKLGKPALFIVVPDFLDHLRSTFSPDSKITYDQLSEAVRTAELLVLDDFGEQASTPWVQEKLYQVINYRYNARLATVITTSLTFEEMDTRIRSRFIDKKISNPFHITVPDYRGDSRTEKKTYRGGRKTS
jgi:DNA replication protein DnaC